MGPKRAPRLTNIELVHWPADFYGSADPDAQRADALIMRLLTARHDLQPDPRRGARPDDSQRDQAARALLRRAHQAFLELDDTKTATKVATLKRALNASSSVKRAKIYGDRWTLEKRVETAETVLQQRLTGVDVNRDLLRAAVSHWPSGRGCWDAVAALASDMGVKGRPQFRKRRGRTAVDGTELAGVTPKSIEQMFRKY